MALLSFFDKTLAATLSGGSWSTALPLSNLRNPLISKTARTVDANTTSTYIRADLGATVPVRVVSLCAHNISISGLVTVRGYSDSGYTTPVAGADSGALNAWPAEAIAAGITYYPKNYTFVFPTVKSARYWQISITDTGNTAGYIELGRCWIGAADFEPAVGVSYGMSNGYESRDVIEESLGGVLWGEKRTPRRRLVAKFDVLTPAEKRQAIIMQKILTETDEAFWVSNATASADDMLVEAFPCFLSKPSPLTYPYYNNHELPIAITERV